MGGDDATSQRSRWEHGHIEFLSQQMPRLLLAALQQRSTDLLVLALDLSIPSMSLLAIAWVGFLVLVLILAWIGSSVGLLVGLLGASGLLAAAGIVSAWSGFASESVSLIDLLKAPIYILWKAPIYLAFLTKPRSRWISTERD